MANDLHTGHPHTVAIDLGSTQPFVGLRYQSWQDENPGRMKEYLLDAKVQPF